MLTGKLLQLSRESLKMLEAGKDKAKPMKMMIVRHEITEFHIDEKSSGWTGTDKPYEKLDWSFFLFDLVRKQISTLPIFKEITGDMVKDYQDVFRDLSADVNKTSQAEHWLGNLVLSVLREQIEGRLTEPRLVEIISTFENEINCSPIQHVLTSYISGLYLKKDSLVLDDNTLIRKLKARDLEYEYHMFAPPFYRLQMMHPTAVIEIKMRIRKDSVLWNKIEKVLSILRLYRLGSVHSLWHDHTKESVMWSMGTSSGWSHTGITELHKYVIEDNEIANLKKFFEVLDPLILIGESDKRAASLSIAIQRYKNTLLDPMDMERKLMTAMMGLESLYSLPSDKGDIGYKLGLRIAKLFSFLGFKSTDVRRNLEKSYYIRNRVAHGLIIDEKKTKEIGNLLNKISEYLRISLIIFLVLGPSQKNDFIALIDDSMVDAVGSQRIQNRIITITEKIPIEILQPTKEDEIRKNID